MVQLNVEEDELLFRLPAALAPAAAEKAQASRTQRTTATAVVAGGARLPGGMSVHLLCRAACPIEGVRCSHASRHRLTGGRAELQYASNTPLASDLLVRLRLAAPRAARLWLQEEEDGRSTAMLLLFPSLADDTDAHRVWGRCMGAPAGPAVQASRRLEDDP